MARQARHFPPLARVQAAEIEDDERRLLRGRGSRHRRLHLGKQPIQGHRGRDAHQAVDTLRPGAVGGERTHRRIAQGRDRQAPRPVRLRARPADGGCGKSQVRHQRRQGRAQGRLPQLALGQHPGGEQRVLRAPPRGRERREPGGGAVRRHRVEKRREEVSQGGRRLRRAGQRPALFGMRRILLGRGQIAGRQQALNPRLHRGRASHPGQGGQRGPGLRQLPRPHLLQALRHRLQLLPDPAQVVGRVREARRQPRGEFRQRRVRARALLPRLGQLGLQPGGALGHLLATGRQVFVALGPPALGGGVIRARDEGDQPRGAAVTAALAGARISRAPVRRLARAVEQFALITDDVGPDHRRPVLIQVQTVQHQQRLAERLRPGQGRRQGHGGVEQLLEVGQRGRQRRQGGVERQGGRLLALLAHLRPGAGQARAHLRKPLLAPLGRLLRRVRLRQAPPPGHPGGDHLQGVAHLARHVRDRRADNRVGLGGVPALAVGLVQRGRDRFLLPQARHRRLHLVQQLLTIRHDRVQQASHQAGRFQPGVPHLGGGGKAQLPVAGPRPPVLRRLPDPRAVQIRRQGGGRGLERGRVQRRPRGARLDQRLPHGLQAGNIEIQSLQQRPGAGDLGGDEGRAERRGQADQGEGALPGPGGGLMAGGGLIEGLMQLRQGGLERRHHLILGRAQEAGARQGAQGGGGERRHQGQTPPLQGHRQAIGERQAIIAYQGRDPRKAHRRRQGRVRAAPRQQRRQAHIRGVDLRHGERPGRAPPRPRGGARGVRRGGAGGGGRRGHGGGQGVRARPRPPPWGRRRFRCRGFWCRGFRCRGFWCRGFWCRGFRCRGFRRRWVRGTRRGRGLGRQAQGPWRETPGLWRPRRTLQGRAARLADGHQRL